MSAPTTSPAGRAGGVGATGVVAPLRGRSARLARRAGEAAAVRAWSSAPAFLALRVERVRSQVDALMWAGILGGLAFTAVNVQTFAAAGQTYGSAGWWVAWLLDPMVSLVLIAVLRAEQVTARWQISTGVWVRRARWFCLAATYVMNTWTAWAAGVPAGVVLHSVPPLVVFVAAEAVTDLRDKLTDAVHAAARTSESTPVPGRAPVAAVPDPVGLQQRNAGWSARWAPGRRVEPETEPFTVPIPGLPQTSTSTGGGASAGAPAASGANRSTSRGSTSRSASSGTRATRRSAGRGTGRPAPGRVLAADYLDRARRALAAEPDPGSVQVTAAWVRQMTGCSRGLSSRLAQTLRDEHPTTSPSATSTASRAGDHGAGDRAPAPATPDAASTGTTTDLDHDPDGDQRRDPDTGGSVNAGHGPAQGAVNGAQTTTSNEHPQRGEDAGSGASEPVRRAA